MQPRESAIGRKILSSSEETPDNPQAYEKPQPDHFPDSRRGNNNFPDLLAPFSAWRGLDIRHAEDSR
jgi:hypothetical protein